MNNIVRKLKELTPRRWTILVVLTMIAASSVLAFSGFSRDGVHEVAPGLFSYSGKTVDVARNGGAPNSDKNKAPDPGGRSTVLSNRIGSQADKSVGGTFVPVKPVKPTKFHGDVRRRVAGGPRRHELASRD